MQHFYRSAADWNAARYPREHNFELSASLLHEEHLETANAEALFETNGNNNEQRLKLLVEVVDGYCDIIYVAYGILWKLGFDGSFEGFEEDLDEFIASHNANQCYHHFHVMVNAFILGLPVIEDESMFCIIMTGLAYLAHLTGSKEKTFACMQAICISNATKSIDSVDSGTKANGEDKGPFYVAPTLALQYILENTNATITH